MRSTLKRVKALESRVLSRGANLYGAMKRLALQHLSESRCFTRSALKSSTSLPR